MAENRNAEWILMEHPEENRPLGRQRRGWKTIKLVGETGWGGTGFTWLWIGTSGELL
jgi:hypothetical protein